MSSPNYSVRTVLASGIVILFLWELVIMGKASVSASVQRGDGRGLVSIPPEAAAAAADLVMNESSSLMQVSPEKIPHKHRFREAQVLVLHIGKSAGGTLIHRVRQQWRLFVEQCHPSPCGAKLQAMNPQPELFLTLRDPVDRFVSAFYWRAYMVCHPDKTKRLWKGPPRGCHVAKVPAARKEAKIIYIEYNMDASRLAEELCSPDPSVRGNASMALQTIQHAKWTISDFLKFDWKRGSANNLFPLVVERGIDSFENQTDQAVHWLYKRRQFEPEEQFVERHRFLQGQNLTATLAEHSSHQLKKDLTPQAEQCLVQFYRKDYEILDQIRQLACKTEACRQGIASMLARRAPLLEQSMIKVQM